MLILRSLEVWSEWGAIVKAIAATKMLKEWGKIFNVAVYGTRTGFKYVAPKITAEKATIGIEESGRFGGMSLSEMEFL